MKTVGKGSGGEMEGRGSSLEEGKQQEAVVIAHPPNQMTSMQTKLSRAPVCLPCPTLECAASLQDSWSILPTF